MVTRPQQAAGRLRRIGTSWRHVSRAPAQSLEWLSVLCQAVTYFRRALKLSRQYLSAWTLMGHEYVEMKNPPAAIGDILRPQLLDVMMISHTDRDNAVSVA